MVSPPSPLRVALISKAFLPRAYRRQVARLAALPGLEVALIVPPAWPEPRAGTVPLEGIDPPQLPWEGEEDGVRLYVLPLRLPGRHHLYTFRGLGPLLDRLDPDLLHIDEEPFNPATWQAAVWAVRRRRPFLFFTWANLPKRIPPPFAWGERWVLGRAAAAVAGNRAAARILRRKGFRGLLEVVPQMGVDPDLFSPGPSALRDRLGLPEGALLVGYVGRLVPEKGILDLVEAVARLGEEVHLAVAGAGTEEARIRARVRALGIAHRVHLLGPLTSAQLPDLYRGLDVLVLPSRTTRRWVEQFGRVLVEAMACGCVAVGSSSGEIPHVLGEAGLVFPEGDREALARVLAELGRDPEARRRRGAAGRRRVLERYTQEAVARRYARLYGQVAGRLRFPEGRE